MGEIKDRIDLANKDFTEGLQDLGYIGFTVNDPDRVAAAFPKGVIMNGNGESISVVGVTEEEDPITPDIPRLDLLHIDITTGEIGVFDVTKSYRSKEKIIAVRTKLYEDIADLELHTETPAGLDMRIGMAGIVDGARDYTRAAYNRAATLDMADMTMRGDLDPVAMVFDRLTEEVRQAYSKYIDGGAFAIAGMIPYGARLVNTHNRHGADRNSDDVITARFHNSVWEQYAEYRGQEAATLQMRALERIIRNGSNAAEKDHASLARQIMILDHLKEGHYITKFTPEVTAEDMRTFPSNANPRPDKGSPTYGAYRWAMGGPESGNTAIMYPDGSVYLGDYPTSGVTRAITEGLAEAEKRHGHFDADSNFVHTGANGVINPGTNQHTEHPPLSFMYEFKNAATYTLNGIDTVPHYQLVDRYATMSDALNLALASDDNIDIEALTKMGPAGTLLAGQKITEYTIKALVSLSETEPALAADMAGYVFEGYGSKDEINKSYLLPGSDPNAYTYVHWGDTRRAFKDPDAKGPKNHFDQLRNKIADLRAALLYAKVEQSAKARLGHEQLQEHFKDMQKPSKTVEQAAKAISTHMEKFNMNWLQEQSTTSQDVVRN